MPDGSYCLEDNHSKLGTRLNSQAVTGPAPLKDGDVIRLGTNLVRFNERRRREKGATAAGELAAAPLPPPPPPPPPSSADKVFAPVARPWNAARKPPVPPPPPPS